MKSDELRKAIGEIDDDLIEASETAGKTEHTIISWTRWGAVAAALVCIITAAVIVPGMLTENVPVTVPDRQQSDIGNIAGRDTAGGEANNISEAGQTDGETEDGNDTDIEKVQIPETEPAGEKNGNPDVNEAGPGEDQRGRDKAPGGASGDIPGAVYKKLSVSYEEARDRFGHPIVRCEAPGFVGYSVGIVSLNGDTGAESSVCLAAEYGFDSGTITVRDESRFSGEFSAVSLVEYEYLGRTFIEDGDTAYGEGRMLVYCPYGEDGDIVYIALFDQSSDIYGIMDLIISLEF